MNNGKICISVCAETAAELIEQIKRAEDLADVIEIRFDCLSESELNCFDLDKLNLVLNKIFNEQQFKKPLLTTFRSKEQGGNRNLSNKERENFWNMGFDSCWADMEEDIVEDSFYWLFQPVICSHHDFNNVSDNLNLIYERLKAVGVDVIKIAVQCDDIMDTIPVWKLLETSNLEKEKSKSEKPKKINFGLNTKFFNFLTGNKLNLPKFESNYAPEFIPIAMGESGKWTRILGLAHGALMTYAALDAGKETAPGQVSAKDLIEVYRAKELDETTEVYGILGSNTSVSMSPYIHNAAFKFHGLNSVFVPLQTHDLDKFIKRMVKPETREIELNFKGFSVTIPHKQNIIKHLDFIDETAKKIGAVNTVKIVDGKLHGYNTDAQGFIEPLLNSYGDLRGAKVAILGAGGAARACIYALKQAGAEVTIFARDIKKAESLAEDFKFQISNFKSKGEDYGEFDILVNTTPLGMKGKNEGETPATAEQLKGLHLVYDLVYIPFQTQLMNEADLAEVPKIGGLAMLIAQAMQQQKIWTEKDAPMKEMSRAVLERLR